ncbi:hypothetical protein ACP70R_016280 [Stipagrostis hirtigluma subsp. patula]
MELGLSLGEAPAARAAPELGLGLAVGVGAGRAVEEAGRGRRADGVGGPGARWWASSPEPAPRLSLVSSLGLQWPSSGNGRAEAPARGLDVNRAPSVAAGAARPWDEEDEEAAAGALSSSPNDSAGSFPLDLGRPVPADAAALGGGERSSSRASDEDEGASARKKLRLSKEQSAFLEESFKEHSTLNPQKQKAALAKQLNLRPRQVEVWFQNRRARTKLKQTEVDCEYLKRCCESLTEENRRLHKELAELRALKTTQPFYMHLPATTLSMCPSCERVASNPASTPAAATPAPAKTAVAAPAPAPEHRPSSFAALFAATRSFQLGSSQPRPPAPAPASSCL